MCIACDKECGLSRNREQLFEKERSGPTFGKKSSEGVRREYACRRWTLRSHRSAPGTRLRLRASVVTTDMGKWSTLHRSGPTPRRDINLIRQAGDTRSIDAVKSITDDSSLNPEVIAASA